MRQAFFDNQSESKPVSYLCQEIRNNDRFASAGHTEQYAVLRSVSEPRFDSNKIASCSVVNRFGAFQMPCESGGPRNHVCKVGVFGGQIEGAISAKCPSRPGLEKKLTRVLGNGCMVNHRASHGNKCVLERGTSCGQLICISMPEPNRKETVERNDFPLLKFCDLFLFGDHIGHQGLFALGDCVDLQPLNMLFFSFDYLVDALGKYAHCDRVLLEPHSGQRRDDSRKRPARPLAHCENRVVVTVQSE